MITYHKLVYNNDTLLGHRIDLDNIGIHVDTPLGVMQTGEEPAFRHELKESNIVNLKRAGNILVSDDETNCIEVRDLEIYSRLYRGNREKTIFVSNVNFFKNTISEVFKTIVKSADTFVNMIFTGSNDGVSSELKVDIRFNSLEAVKGFIKCFYRERNCGSINIDHEKVYLSNLGSIDFKKCFEIEDFMLARCLEGSAKYELTGFFD